MISDPVADLLIRIKNATLAKKKSVLVPYSRFKGTLAKVLQAEGFIKKVEVVGGETKKDLLLTLAEEEGKARPIAVKIISKPGRRVYFKAKGIRILRRGRGTAIISTPSGLMTDREAQKKNLGGEVICKVS